MAYQKSHNKEIENMSYNQAYSPTNFNTSLNIDEMDVLRKRLIQNIADLNLNKHRLRADEFNQLTNYHHYALNILNNMQNIKQVEMANPYNRNMQSVMGGQAQPGIESINPYEKKLNYLQEKKGLKEKRMVIECKPVFIILQHYVWIKQAICI